MKICSIDGCERRHLARGWCGNHYQRWSSHGDPLAGDTRYATPEESFAARVAWDGEHLIWIGSSDGHGYGHLKVGGRMEKAHRYSWSRENGQIPAGAEIDHTCWVPACVLPGHLRPATRVENVRNRSGVRRGRKFDLPRGVRPARSGPRFSARVKHEGREVYLGTFDTPEEASAAAEAKRSELFGEDAGAA